MQKNSKPKTARKLHKELWRLVSEYIRRKDADDNGYVACCTCGRMVHWRTQANAGHYIDRTHKAVLYDEMNIAPQCRLCNKFRQGKAVDFREYLVKKYGEKAIRDLEQRRNFPAGYTQEGLALKITEYKRKLAELKNEA